MANTWTIGNQNYSNMSYSVTGATGAVGSGQYLTTSGLNGTSWTSSNTSFNSSNNKAILTIPHGEEKVVLSESATLEVKGTVRINGRDLEERLKTIEKVLMIPERDVTLEASYPLLKKKYDDYIETLSKYRMWDSIKGNEND